MNASVTIADLWRSSDAKLWEQALAQYWHFVQPKNEALERSLEQPGLRERVGRLTAEGWYDFLLNEYFLWKYTASNRYVTTTGHLKEFKAQVGLEKLAEIHRELLVFDSDNIWLGLATARKIKGLGTAGSSGLLALLYPEKFGTVDQFLVKALQGIEDLPQVARIQRMKPDNLSVDDAIVLICILRDKAKKLSAALETPWTPRKLDKVLWTFGHQTDATSPLPADTRNSLTQP